MSAPATLPRIFDLSQAEEAYGRARGRRQNFYFLVGTTACLLVVFAWTLASLLPQVARQSIPSSVGGAVLAVIGILVAFLIGSITIILCLRPGAATVRVDLKGIDFQYPSGRRQSRAWRDRRACVDLYEFRVNRLDAAWSHLPAGEIYHGAAPPNSWSPISFLTEEAYSAIDSEAKRQGLSFSRRPLYGGWGNTPSAIIRISIRPAKPEPPISPSSVRYLLRINR
jgi:hypothetical protein